ncbi:MAG: DUF4332 domain-containing protein [Candidatus Methanosuratincola sp.]|jgi:predicted flap endonuclease-1-like 5' DNA nuclease|nr:DUF4332 domain-containing protein [Candidatus Methanosuratincola sp.]
MPKITEIEGIGEVFATKLKDLGITTTEQLLEAGATRKGRDQLAEKSGISPKLILKWINRADLFRVKGIGQEYSDLLEAAGVDTVVELGTRNADNLYAKLVEINNSKNLVRKLPSLEVVKDWIEQAKKLPRKVEY